MANEFVHSSVGTTLTQSEFEAVGLHAFNSQATGDILYATSATQLSRLGIGSANDVLQVIGGIPAWTTNPTIASPTFTGTVTLPTVNSFTMANAAGIAAVNADDNYFFIQVRRNGVGLWEALRFTGGAIPLLTLQNGATVTGLKLSDYLGLWKTDVDSSTEGYLWYDDSENVLKYYNGTTVKTVATV